MVPGYPLVKQYKNGMAPVSLQRHVGVRHGKAWPVKHKLLEAMAQPQARLPPEGVAFADEAAPSPSLDELWRRSSHAAGPGIFSSFRRSFSKVHQPKYEQ